jgi:HEAT repeat protein
MAFTKDVSCLVRFSLARALRNIQAAAAKDLITELAKDTSGRIRAVLANDLVGQPYYFDFVAPLLEKDLDWAVRCALASALEKSKSVAKAAQLCAKFMDDAVWQVQCAALISMTKILSQQPKQNVALHLPLLKLAKSPHLPLKTAALNCFFAHKTQDDAKFIEFCEEVWKGPRDLQLRFLELIAESPMVQSIQINVMKLIDELALEIRWRTRLSVIAALRPLETTLKNPDVKLFFTNLCLKLMEDEATPVRDAAMMHLALGYVSESDKIPPLVDTLKASNCFRRRQAAIGILNAMYRVTKRADFRERIVNVIRTFEADPVDNVSLLAIATVRELTR